MSRAAVRKTGRLATAAITACVAAALGTAARPGGDEPETPERAARETRMKRTKRPAAAGIATSLLPVQDSPQVVFRIVVRAGAIDDPPGKEGLNTLTAMTLGQGGSKTLSYREVTDRLYPMAASISPQADMEVTTLIGRVHRDHLKEFYEIFTGVLLTPRFDPADFARNRDLLLAAIETNLRGADDETLGKEALQALMFQGHPYGRPVIGTVQGLRSITLDDVKAHYRRHYARGAVVLGVAGGYPKGMIETLLKDFEALPALAPERPKLPAPRALQEMEVLIVDKPAPATAISIGFPIGVTRADRDYYALLVANSYFGEHRTFNGRLQNVMRAARGLNYGDYSYIENFLQDGGSTFPLANIPRRQQHFSIWIRPVAPPNAGFALRQAVRELQRLAEQGLTAAEFEATRKYLLNYSRLWTQSLSRRLGYRLDSEYYGTKFTIDRVQEELPRLKVEDVNAAIKRHLQAKNLAVAIVAPDAAALADLLVSGKPTRITYQTPTTSEDLLREDREIESFPLRIHKERLRVVPAGRMFER
jgi:zinc protease